MKRSLFQLLIAAGLFGSGAATGDPLTATVVATVVATPVANGDRAATGASAFTVRLRNETSRSIAAYAFRVEVPNAKGEMRVRTVSRAERTNGHPAGQDPFRPYSEWDHGTRYLVPVNKNGVELPVSIRVDFVQFADGSFWAPGKTLQPLN
jgi:hypothetical protein